MSKKIKANIAKFKTHLGLYMRKVRKGEEVIVVDRQTPMAKLIPYSEEMPLKLETIKPIRPLGNLSDFIGKPTQKKTDSLAILLQDREE